MEERREGCGLFCYLKLAYWVQCLNNVDQENVAGNILTPPPPKKKKKEKNRKEILQLVDFHAPIP